jgi:hypothetical protein
MSPRASPGAPGLKGLQLVLAGFDFGAEVGFPEGVAVAESRRAGIAFAAAVGDRSSDGSDTGAVVRSAILVGSIGDECNRLSRRDNPVVLL